MARKKYTEEQKVEYLKVFEMNNFNYNLTTKMTGVSRNALMKWEKDIGKWVFKRDRLPEPTPKEKTEKISDDLDLAHEGEEQSFIAKAYAIRMKLLDRIDAMVPTERNLYNVVKAVQAVDDIVNKKEDGEEDESGLTFMEQLTLKLTKNGQSDSADRDSKELPS